MPSILNLKFKGNKSFVPFSNLSDVDSLTKTWKVCTKVASFLEQGQRLENLSWRLWHLQNLMVETDNAKSKREFRKLSKCMSDKLDKEKGRSIEELQAPGFRRNHSTDIIQQRAIEKEREREAQSGRPGIHRMQFTFSVDQPLAPTGHSPPAQKPDLKPSPEFKDSCGKRGRPSTRSTAVVEAAPVAEVTTTATTEKDQPLTQRGRKQSTTDASNAVPTNDGYSHAALRFPSLFSNDFGPAALLYPSPSLTNVMTYGEGLNNNASGTDGFSIIRPTIELPLDEILNADSPGGWSSSVPSSTEARHSDLFGHEDIEMKHDTNDHSYTDGEHQDEALLTSTAALRNVPPLSQVDDILPRTITPSRLGGPPSATPVGTKRPSLSLRTQVNRASGPSATPVNGTQSANNTAPGGVKAECSNCGATHTPLWRRGLNDELNCNACGLYCKLHKRPRPKSMRNNHGEGRNQAAPRQESQEVVGAYRIGRRRSVYDLTTSAYTAQCYNCHTTATPLWRKDDEGKTVCNACGLYYKLHGSARPISMKSDVIRKRARHDARRGNGSSSETPSASPGASRRASPIADGITATDVNGQINYGDEQDYNTSTSSELMGALGENTQTQQNGQTTNDANGFASQFTYTLNYPGPYHPDYIPQLYNIPADALPFAGETSDFDGSETRSVKRRRMSNDSASDPPSSATSYGSYGDSYSSSSASSQSQPSSLEFPFSYSYSLFGRQHQNVYPHPPMLPVDGNSTQYIHPPMVAPEDTPMDFLHNSMQHDDADTLFATYMHPPMLPPDDSPKAAHGSLQPHPPMLPNDWAHSYDFHDTSMQVY